jgi:hypothetical protein
MKHIGTIVLLLTCAALFVHAPGMAQSPSKHVLINRAAADQAPVSITTPGPEGTTTFILQEFEQSTFPPAGWTSQGTGSAVWIRSTDASGYGTGAGSAFADFFSISNGGTFHLITPAFPPSSAGDSVRFDHAYATYTSENDQLQISTSTNGGTTWVTLVTLAGGVSGPLVTAPPTTNPFVPNASQWATKAYALPVGTTKVRFTGISAYGNDLFVDNIMIGAPYANDVGLLSIDQPGTAVPPNIFVPQVTVKNYGLATQSFPVQLTISPGAYTSTQNVTNLAPGAVQQVSFQTWVPSMEGYTLTAVAQLTGDENGVNDTLTSFHVISDVPRSVLLEYATGTWCQWCPCGDNTADALLTTYPDLVVLAYHGPANAANDPWTVFNGNTVIASLGLSSYPTAILDRQNAPGDYTTWTGFTSNRYTNFSVTPVTIAIDSQTYNPANRQLTATVAMTSNATLPFQYKVNYVLTEDNLVYNQTGNTTCPGSTTWVHKRVVRTMVNGATGDSVNVGTWNPGQTITKSFTTTLTAGWVPGNCNLNIFVYKTNPFLGSAEVQNAIVVPVVPPVSVDEVDQGIPVTYELGQNYPNPFNPETNIRIAIRDEGFVSLKVFDITGREVLTGVQEVLKPGVYNVLIDASLLPSGVYFYRLNAAGFSETKKMTVLR